MATGISQTRRQDNFFQKFPTKYRERDTFEGVPDSVIKEIQGKYYPAIARRIANLYADTILSNDAFLKTHVRNYQSPFNSANLDRFREKLIQYISTKLSDGNSVDLVTNKGPQGELKVLMNECNIDFTTFADGKFSLLPMQSSTFLSPRYQEEYCNLAGYTISIESEQSELPTGMSPDLIPSLLNNTSKV